MKRKDCGPKTSSQMRRQVNGWVPTWAEEGGNKANTRENTRRGRKRRPIEFIMLCCLCLIFIRLLLPALIRKSFSSTEIFLPMKKRPMSRLSQAFYDHQPPQFNASKSQPSMSSKDLSREGNSIIRLNLTQCLQQRIFSLYAEHRFHHSSTDGGEPSLTAAAAAAAASAVFCFSRAESAVCL